MQAITQSPGNYLPRPGMCGTIRPLPPAQLQQRNRNGTVLFFNTLQNQLDAPFCLGLIVSILSEPTLLYIYENSLTPVGNLSVRSDAIIFNLNGQDAFLPANFSGFAQLQLCANGTHMKPVCWLPIFHGSTVFCTWSIRDGSNFTYCTLSQFHSSV